MKKLREKSLKRELKKQLRKEEQLQYHILHQEFFLKHEMLLDLEENLDNYLNKEWFWVILYNF